MSAQSIEHDVVFDDADQGEAFETIEAVEVSADNLPAASRNQTPINQEAYQAPAELSPGQMLQMAIQSGATPETLSKFMDLMERHEASEARKAYVLAMNAFKSNPPTILKDHLVSFDTSKGTTAYMHARLGSIVAAVCESLASNGLSHRWDVDQLDGGQIKVTCIITHSLGHSEGVPMQAGADQSGGKNNIQAVASTVSYLQRYTLLSATGLATMDMDNDGAGSEPAEDIQLISPEQALELHAKLTDNDLSVDSFIGWMKQSFNCGSIDDLYLSSLPIANKRIDSAIRAKNKGGNQ